MDTISQLVNLTTASDGLNSSNLFYIILIILPIALIIFFIIKKKKGNSNDKSPNGNRLKNKQEADEVWLTIKRYLRDKSEKGKEVVDSYVVKRPDPFNVSAMTKEQKQEWKQKQKEFKALKKTDPDQYKLEKARIAIQKRKKPAELYVVLFTTKNTKTGTIDNPRAIECEVTYKKINKNNRERIIVINKLLNYDEEMKWIQPIKAKDDKQWAKQLQREQRVEARLKAKKEKQKLKEQQKKDAQKLAEAEVSHH
ncbi:DUF5385 family protein [Ureaplasma ceti]|uniref:Uncharacterized protein n=1 Tax=Ureaplasma ceti TaxID=3119530 RepID=A0ABP9U898_9BACT